MNFRCLIISFIVVLNYRTMVFIWILPDSNKFRAGILHANFGIPGDRGKTTWWKKKFSATHFLTYNSKFSHISWSAVLYMTASKIWVFNHSENFPPSSFPPAWGYYSLASMSECAINTLYIDNIPLSDSDWL